MQNFQHWKIEENNEGIVWLSMDVDGASANVLSAAVLAELNQLLVHYSNKLPKGIAITSAKESSRDCADCL